MGREHAAMSQLNQFDVSYVILRKEVTTLVGLFTKIKAPTKNNNRKLFAFCLQATKLWTNR